MMFTMSHFQSAKDMIEFDFNSQHQEGYEIKTHSEPGRRNEVWRP